MMMMMLLMDSLAPRRLGPTVRAFVFAELQASRRKLLARVAGASLSRRRRQSGGPRDALPWPLRRFAPSACSPARPAQPGSSGLP